MNSMNENRFFDLAMRSLARQATDAERDELNSLVANHPEFKAEFERLRAEVILAKETLPLVEAAEATSGALPGYARERLQTKVRQTLGRPEPVKPQIGWSWKWWLALAPVAALLLLLFLPLLTPSNTPVVQLAMLDNGATRGSSTEEIAMFKGTWKSAPVQSFDTMQALEAWEQVWPAKGSSPEIKVIYDKGAAEVRVVGRVAGSLFQKSFMVENDLPTTLKQADEFIREHLKRRTSEPPKG